MTIAAPRSPFDANDTQGLLFPAGPDAQHFPRTRYQGSKRKLTGVILNHLRSLTYDSVLDAFGGTGSIAYAFKCIGKRVTYNDVLAFNEQIGLALIENDSVRLANDDVESVVTAQPGRSYGCVIERRFGGIYFTDAENRWLDVAVANIRAIDCRFKRAIAWFALIQAALAKRPYNLFHRANLYMRTADVPRSFGNKASWDRSFEDHFRAFVRAANAGIVDGGEKGGCRAVCFDALDVPGEFDLVYIDPPYINQNGVGVDYRDFYHFLEGMQNYDAWAGMIDARSKHKRLLRRPDPWSNAAESASAFERLFARFRKSTLVVSYRSDGTPSLSELEAMLRKIKRNVRLIEGERYQYALSTKRATREALLIATD